MFALWIKQRQCDERDSSQEEQHIVTMQKLNPNTPFQMGHM